ncbi:MAG: 1-deoxy-D-xylulose-5-phosphate reductoisomerase [Victivallaceae bacterium]|nr:1-deoxy-D-xylulose-5-phosphate reductoisomerase [Victivallaceae bacterium]
MKKLGVAVLGSTGSIGGNAVKILEAYPDWFRTVGLVARSQTALLAEQGAKLNADWIASDGGYDELSRLSGRTVEFSRVAGLICAPEVDVVLCAIVGTAGLPLVLAALGAGKRVALASKEVLVMAGDLVKSRAAAGNGRIIPVDSEHSAIFQCLEGRRKNEVARLVLTASGGSLRNATDAELENATLERVLRHPTWRMGRKVTIDSATLMNKALEVIEAGYLFDFPPEKIKAVIHPESVVHSLIEMMDGTLLAQMSRPDMRFAIGYGMSWPDRLDGRGLPRLDFSALGSLEFSEIDRRRFPSLDFAEAALRCGGTLPCVLNAANEVAVDKFVRGEIRLPRIWSIVDRTMAAHRVEPLDGLDTVLAADRRAREYAGKLN